MFLKVLCDNGDQTVLWLDAFMVDHLFRHFETVLIGSEPAADSPVRTKFLESIVNSLGTVPRSQN